MPEVPTDVYASDLLKKLKRTFQYDKVPRKKKGKGSHIKICKPDGKMPITIPFHKPLKRGTLRSILLQVAEYENLSLEAVLDRLKL